jgi:hypothetical protein
MKGRSLLDCITQYTPKEDEVMALSLLAALERSARENAEMERDAAGERLMDVMAELEKKDLELALKDELRSLQEEKTKRMYRAILALLGRRPGESQNEAIRRRIRRVWGNKWERDTLYDLLNNNDLEV